MPKQILTTGDSGLDRELDALWTALRAAQGAPTTTQPLLQPPVQLIRAQSSLDVQDVAGTTVILSPAAIEFDGTTSDYAVSADAEMAKIGRTATAVSPAPVAAAAAAGTSQHAANADHAHAGVTSVATVGNLVAASASQGAITLTVKVPVVGADPVSPAAGDLWYRSDLNQLCLYTGSAIKRSAAFT